MDEKRSLIVLIEDNEPTRRTLEKVLTRDGWRVLSGASVAEGLAWAADYSEPQLRALGWAEVLGAVGLVVPPLVGLGIVTPVAASCLAALTLGALVVHVRRREFLPDALRTIALILMCVVLAYWRFGPEAF